MPGLDVGSWSATLLAVAFLASATLVWIGGARIAAYAAEIADRTGMQRALLGVLLLGLVTSLPELTTVVTAASRGSEALALNNLLGGVALQVVILAIADAAAGREPLSSIVARPVVLLIGTVEIVLLTLAAGGALLGDVEVFGVGATALLLTLLFLPAMLLIRSIPEDRQPWALRDHTLRRTERTADDSERTARAGRTTLALTLLTLAAAAAVLAGGYVLTLAAEDIAQRTGLGQSFVGATLLAGVTSLPEVSATVAAARAGEYELAFSNVFGSNLLLLALVLLVDVVGDAGPSLSLATAMTQFSMLLGIAVTAIYLAGLIERSDQRIWRFGVDSVVVLLVYSAGVVIMYRLRGG